MDKFELALLAQLKEHNRLTKELVKLQQAVINEPKKVSTEIFSAVKPKPAHWISNFDKPVGYDINGHRTWYLQIMCSNCGFKTTAIEGHTGQYRYCPNCGLEMEKGDEENA